jgi:CHASE3 domain sensor protein/putative methionine-R-sulfoxide reductase with GAF domain
MQAIAPIRALPIGSRLLLALGCGLFVLVGQSLLAYRTVAANRAANDSALHARDVIAVANEALTAIIDMQNGFRGYVLTGDSSFLDRRAANRQLFEDRLNHLVALSADLPDQVARWRQVEARLATWEQTAIQPGLALRLNSVDGRVPVEVAPIIFDSQAQVDDIRSIFAEAIGIEQAVEDDRSRAAEDANALLLAVMFFGTLLTGAVGFGLIWLMARDMRGELARVANAASAIAAGDLDQRVDGVRTFEIAQTAAALNRVAAALKRDVERLRAIIAAQADIAGAEMQPDVLLNLVAERAQALTGATGAVIELVEDQEMVFRAASGTVGPSLGLRLQMAGSLSGLSVRTGETLYCEDTSADERVDVEACRRMGAGSMVVTPLVYDGQTIGVLKVLSPEPRAFSPRDIDTLQLAAGLLGTALAHAHAFQDKERSEARFRAVTESAHEAIIAAGPEGRLMFWNPAAIRLFDYEPAELLDMPFERILPDRAALVDLGRAGGST